MSIGVPVLGQESEAKKTGVPDDWSHHHLIFPNPGTGAQATADGRFPEWYKTVADPRFKIQQLKRGAAAGATRQVGTLWSLDPRKNVLERDWGQLLGPAASTSVYVAPGMYGAKFTFFTSSAISSPSCSDYVVFGVDATPSGTQPNLVGLTNLYVNSTGTGSCSGTAPTVMFAYDVGSGPVITSPSLGSVSGQVLYVESASTGAKLHVLKGAGTGSGNGSVSSPVAPGTGNTASDTAVLLSGNHTVTYSSAFYVYTADTAYVGDDDGYLHKISPVFAGTPTEVSSTGADVWPAVVSSGNKLTAPVYDYSSAKVWVSDGAKLYSVSPTIGSGSGGIVPSASVGSDIVDAPIVDSTNELVYLFVGSVPEVAQFTISSFASGVAATHTATVGTASTTVPLHMGDFNNNYYSGTGTEDLYVCGNPGGNPTLYSVLISSLALSTVTAGPVLASSDVACSPLTEYYNTNTSTDWLFGGVPANSCGATNGVTAGGCVMSFNITSAAPTIGPWLPSTDYSSTSDEVVDTNGNLEEISTTGTSLPVAPTWSTTSGATTIESYPNPALTSISCTDCTEDSTTDSIAFTNSSGATITFSQSSSLCGSGNITLSPSTGSLTNGSQGTISITSTPNTGCEITIGSIEYYIESSITGGTLTSPYVLYIDHEHGELAENLYAAITGVTGNCYSTDCFSFGGPIWTNKGASNGQTTAAAPTGTSGLIIDNSGSSAGQANIYFGTLSGTGAQSEAIKLSQSGLH